VTAIFVQERFALETATTAPGNGVIVVTPAQPTYAPGERVMLEAIPAAGSFFDRWGGAASGIERVLELVMTDSVRVTARFGEEVYSLRTETSGGGSVVVEPAQESYAPGVRVTLTARPIEGWRFTGWEGHLTGDSNPATMVMNASKTVGAMFELTEPFEGDLRIFLPAIHK
jgi:hypothetical protein